MDELGKLPFTDTVLAPSRRHSSKGISTGWLANSANFPISRDGVHFAVTTPLVIDCTKAEPHATQSVV
jgi:hypothetical protein